MSSSDMEYSRRRILMITAAGATGVLITGCGFSPAYAPSSGHTSPLASTQRIFVERPGERVDQVLRNELLFYFGQNTAIEPGSAEYSLDLTSSFKRQNDIVTRRGVSQAGTIVGIVSYELRSRGDGETIVSGKASSRASYDLFEQEFANLRARRDAEDRAARDIAAKINARVVAYFAAST